MDKLNLEEQEFLLKYHNEAKNNNPETSEISLITIDGSEVYGFTYGKHTIFLEDFVMCVMEFNEIDNIHELAIYEIEDLSL